MESRIGSHSGSSGHTAASAKKQESAPRMPEEEDEKA